MKRKKLSKKIIAFCMCIIIVCCAVPSFPVSASYKKATYDDVKNETTESLKEQIDALQQLLDENSAALKEAEQRQADAEEKRSIFLTMSALYDDTLATMDAELLLMESEVEKTGEEYSACQKEYDDTYQTFLDMLRMSYEEGTVSYIEIILGASSISDLLSRIDRVNSLMGYSSRLMKSLSGQKEALDKRYTELNEKLAEHEAAIAALEQKKQEADDWNAEYSAEIEQIEAEINALVEKSENYTDQTDVLDAEFQAEVKKLEEEENAKRAAQAEALRQKQLAEAEAKKAAEEQARLKAIEEANRNQGFLWPLPQSWAHVTSQYGMRLHPVYKKYQMHYGIDIAAASGTNIYASKDGKVTVAKYHVSYGYYVIIDHADGTSSLYAHCSKLIAKAGNYVKRGEVIALVGTTGTSTGNHLHYEIRVNGSCVDPISMLGTNLPKGIYYS